jgi:hypothetical protein
MDKNIFERHSRLVLLGFFLCVFLVIEVILRWTLVPINLTYHFEQGAFTKDKELGYVLTSNYQGTMSDGHFLEDIVTNTSGYRDIFDKNLPNPGIFAIGDSQTFGHGLAAKFSWP